MVSKLARSACGFGFLSMLVVAAAGQAAAQEVTIEWEIANRFRLFAEQIDFDMQVRAFRAISGKTVLETEQKLADQSRGNGWAAGVHRLCYDSLTGQVPARCRRDGVEESYLRPKDLRITLAVKLPADFGNAKCTWTIGAGEEAKTVPDRDCYNFVNDQRVTPSKATVVSVTALSDSGASVQASITVAPRDVLIVGLGDSTASGEGNPTKPVALNDNGFCFRRVLLRDRDRFFLPGRARANVVADCPLPGENRDQRDEWEAANAEWQFAPCHLSLYSYQARTALELAIENPAVSVTYYPLGCTGATIRQGLLGPQSARERPKRGTQIFPRTVRGQIDQLTAYLGGTGNNPARRPDLIFLTVGGNDLKFSGLVADLLVANDPERRILRDRSLISTVADSRQALGPLGDDFKAL